MKKMVIAGPLLLICTSLFADQSPQTPLEQASKEQQKSISQLVTALKEVRKVIMEPGENDSPEKEKKKNPFKDKQEFKNQPPANALQDLEKQQKEIITELKKQKKTEGSQGSGGEQKKQELEQKQQQISDRLKELAEQQELDASVKEQMKEAAASSDKTAEAIRTSISPETQVSAEKTLSKISQAFGALRKQAEEVTEKALDQAALKLSLAEQARQENNGEKSAEIAREAEQLLSEASQQQKRTGSRKKEKQLAQLAKLIRDKNLPEDLARNPGSQITEDKLADVREAVAQARQGDRTDREELKDSMEKLKELQQEMQFMAKHPEEIKKEELIETMCRCSGSAQRLGRVQSKMSGMRQGTEKSPAPAISTDMHAIEKMTAQWSLNGTDHPPREITLKTMIELTDSILIKAQQILDPLEKKTIVRNFAKDEIPEKYQEDVATYFKRLSETDKQ